MSGSRGRISFVIAALINAALFAGLYWVTLQFELKDEALLASKLTVGAGALYVGLMLAAQRFRDLGLPGSVALLALAPLGAFYDDLVLLATSWGVIAAFLCFMPGARRTKVDVWRDKSGPPLQLR